MLYQKDRTDIVITSAQAKLERKREVLQPRARIEHQLLSEIHLPSGDRIQKIPKTLVIPLGITPITEALKRNKYTS